MSTWYVLLPAEFKVFQVHAHTSSPLLQTNVPLPFLLVDSSDRVATKGQLVFHAVQWKSNSLTWVKDYLIRNSELALRQSRNEILCKFCLRLSSAIGWKCSAGERTAFVLQKCQSIIIDREHGSGRISLKSCTCTFTDAVKSSVVVDFSLP